MSRNEVESAVSCCFSFFFFFPLSEESVFLPLTYLYPEETVKEALQGIHVSNMK